ncbi:MAG: signal peptidase I [Actinobacteria bacterium]|nr:signal peptidase I [Actinomycetota bacterium]
MIGSPGSGSRPPIDADPTRSAPSWRRRAGQLLGWIAIAVVGFVAWPSQWGGDTTYVIVKGNSMLPNFHTGDIVIARSVDELEIGDVVVYAVPDGAGKGKLIMHRFVDVRLDGTLVIQGDNRDQPDQFDITTDDVAGVARVHLPKVGLLVRYMGTWWFIAATVSLFVFVHLWPEDEDSEDEDSEDEDSRVDGDPPRGAGGSGPPRREDGVLAGVASGTTAGGTAAVGASMVNGSGPPASDEPSAGGSRVFVDGDTVMALWADADRNVAIRRCLELCATAAHTFGTRITVVFPHGAHGTALGRVNPEVMVVDDGRTVRDLARAAPRGALGSVHAVVVTSDAQLARDVQATGVATIPSGIWRDLVVG